MIKNIIICLLSIVVLLIILFIAVYIFLEKDRERCMNMTFNEMMQDRSCTPYWEALNE